MSTPTMIFKALSLPTVALSAAMLWSIPANANGTKVYCPDGGWVYEPDSCYSGPTTPTPQPITNTATGGSSTSTATGVGIGTGIGVGGNATGGNATGGSVGPITVGGGAGGVGHGGAGGNAVAGVNGSGNSTNRNTNQQKQDQYQRQGQGQSQQANNSNVNNIDASSRHNYEAAANSIILGSAYAGEDECKVGGTLGASTVGAQAGGGFNVIDKSCAVVRQMRNERLDICGMFGPQSRECASATYHTSAIGAMAMVESGRVVEKSGPRVGIAPAKQPAREASLVKAWNEGEARRSQGIDPCRLNPSKCE